MNDYSNFPDPTYNETVLAPLFEGVKAHFAKGMDAINRAHLVMLAETGIIPPEDAAAIAKTLRALEAELEPEKLTYTGEHEDYFFLIEHELRARLGDLGGALHTARSRNDMDHTLFRLALLDRAAILQSELHALISALLDKAEAEAETLIVAYTHGQPAQPSTFGHYLAALAEVLLRDAARLDAAIQDLDFCPMGAAAITTSGFAINRHRVAELLGFAEPTMNSYGSIASVDYITGLYSAMRLIFLHLTRPVQDFAFWSAFEVGQLYVPDAFVQVSSIMPQKRNPVPIEHMRHLASTTAGRCETMLSVMQNTPFTDMNDSEGEVQQAGFSAFASGGRMLRLLAAFLPACQINAARVARTTDAACITITELADTLVREEALSFRQAHEIAAATAAAVIAADAPLAEGHAAFARAFAAETGRETRLGAAAFAEAVDARSFVARRDRHGGPAPAALADAFASYRARLGALTETATQRQTRREAAAQMRQARFDKL